MLTWIFKISRPRFWFYLLGPFLLGIAAYEFLDFSTSIGNYQIGLILAGLFFTLPANLLIYGTNDLFDYETDKNNPKKKDYEVLLAPEQRKRFNTILLAVVLPILVVLLATLLLDVNTASKTLTFDPNLVGLWSLTGFLFFGIGYSAPPIRAKVRPFVDSFFNILYIFPGLISYGILTEQWPPMYIILAATLWCMAMHAFSAVPDITADKKAGLRTIATELGKENTLLFCFISYGLAGALTFTDLGLLSIIGSTIYLTLMVLAYKASSKAELFSVYKLFPYVNVVLGFTIFWYVILSR